MVGLLWLAACGSEEAPTAQLAPLAVESTGVSGNRAPIVRDVRLEPSQPARGDQVRAMANVQDPDGDAVELNYEWWIDGVPMTSRGDSLELAGTPTGAEIEVRVTAHDGQAWSDPTPGWARVIDRAPMLHGIAIEPTSTVYPGDRVVVTPTGSDPDGDPVDFVFEWTVNGERVDAEGRSFSTAGLSTGDRIRVRVMASDGSNESRAQESADVVVGSAHPEIVSSPPGMTDAGVFRYAVEARDPDGDRNLRYRLAEAPEGMSIDDVLGEIEWRPAANQTGRHKVSVVVRDSSRLETTQSFEVTVSARGESVEPATPAAQADVEAGAADEE